MSKTYWVYWRTKANRSFLRELTDIEKANALYEQVASRPSTRLIILKDVTDRKNIKTIRED